MARSTWITSTADDLCAALATRGVELDQSVAEQFVRSARDDVAARMRVTTRTAQTYMHPGIIENWANQIAGTATATPPAPRRHLHAVK
jgi:hypothetical protein